MLSWNVEVLEREGTSMPTIRVSDESLERLRKWAVPLKDTPDAALRKVLDAAEKVKEEGGCTAEE